ncbi:MAG: hypothetical protein ACKV2T_14060 [Kofleriaceae bacterium]
MKASITSVWIVCAVASASAFAEGKPPKITSKETGLYPSKACKTKIAGGEGQDPVLKCPAMKGFEVEVSFAATTTQVSITGNGKTTSLSGLVGNKLEWRLADGKPFAILVENAIDDTDEQGDPIARNRRVEVYSVGGTSPMANVPLPTLKPATRKMAWAKARTLADAIVSPLTK